MPNTPISSIPPDTAIPPLRSTSVAEILRRFQKHDGSPLRCVTHLTKVHIHPSLHVFLAGANPAWVGAGPAQGPRGLRSYCGGKGITEEAAKASALCEAVERLSGEYLGTEETIYAPYVALESAIHPDELQPFSPLQFAHRAELNQQYAGFCEIPPRFDPLASVCWSPARSLSTGLVRHVPTAWAYYGAPQESGSDYFRASSNGCAAGSTREEALLSGLLELIERDSVACWWYSRAPRPMISWDSSWSAAERIVSALADLGREVWLLDLTSDIGVPVCVAVSRRTGPGPEEIVMGFGAHFEMRLAAERSLCELAQLLPEATLAPARADGFHHFNPSITYWWRNARVREHPFLAPAPGARASPQVKLPQPGVENLEEALNGLVGALGAIGLQVFFIDQTRPEVGLAVVRAIVPGLRPIWPAFAPGRLYRVPVQLGWLTHEPMEHTLNPMPIPA